MKPDGLPVRHGMTCLMKGMAMLAAFPPPGTGLSMDNRTRFFSRSQRHADSKGTPSQDVMSAEGRTNRRGCSCEAKRWGARAAVWQVSGHGPARRVFFVALVLVIAMCGAAKNAYSAEGQENGILPVGEPALPGKKTAHAFSGQENSPQSFSGFRAESYEDIPASAESEEEESASGAKSPYDSPGEEDTLLKRRARLQGMRMRRLYGPELAYQGFFINSKEESGSRHTVAATMPLTESWEGAVFEHVSFFSLKRGNDSAGRESARLRIGMNPGRSFRPWFALTPYFNFGEAEGQGLGVAAGISNTWRNGANLSGEVFAWRPWDEGYSTIVEDGRKHGVALAFTLPFTRKLLLSGRAYYEELELGGGAKSGAQNAGRRYALNARAYCRLLHRDGAYMGYGFRDDDLWNEYLTGSELGIFVQADFQRYSKPDGFEALHPVPEVFAQEMGISFQYAFSPHLGLTAEGFIGRDPDRDLQFGELAGLNGRLMLVANPHLRIWAGASYVKTTTTLESSGGEETIVSLGITYAF